MWITEADAFYYSLRSVFLRHLKYVNWEVQSALLNSHVSSVFKIPTQNTNSKYQHKIPIQNTNTIRVSGNCQKKISLSVIKFIFTCFRYQNWSKMRFSLQFGDYFSKIFKTPIRSGCFTWLNLCILGFISIFQSDPSMLYEFHGFNQ